MPQHADRVGQRVRRIGDDENQRLRLGGVQTGDNVLVDLDIGVEESQPAGRIVTVSGPTGFFVHAGGNHDQRGAFQVGVITLPHFDGGRQDRAVLDVGNQPSCPFSIAIEDDDFAGTTPGHEGRQTRRPDGTCANYSTFMTHSCRSADPASETLEDIGCLRGRTS